MSQPIHRPKSNIYIVVPNVLLNQKKQDKNHKQLDCPISFLNLWLCLTQS